MAEIVSAAWLPDAGRSYPVAGDERGWHRLAAQQKPTETVLRDLLEMGYTWVRLKTTAPRPLYRDVGIHALMWGLV